MTAAETLSDPAPLRLTAPVAAEVVTLPFSLVRRSPLNPRKSFDHAALVELAVNIYQRTPRDEAGTITGTGIMQNLMARPDAEQPGGAEIAAGERRYRAVELLVQGLTAQVQDGTDANGRPVMVEVFYQVPDTYPLPLRVEAMTDADLIETATVENIQRQDMTPMEEADAYLALKRAGRTEEYIALKYGKHPNTVRSRIQLAEGLGKEGRKLLEAGEISLEHAKVIASNTGGLKKSLTEQARAGASVSSLKHLVKNGAFLVENALFDVAASGLRVDEGLLGDFPAKFTDPKKALGLQVETLEAVKVCEEESGQWPGGVVVLPVESEYAHLPSRDWVYANQRPEEVPAMLVLTYSTATGRSQRCEGVARLSDVQTYRREQQEAAERARDAAQQTGEGGGAGEGRTTAPLSEAAGSGRVREAAHVLGHQARGMALDGYLAAHPSACLALACESLIQASSHTDHRNVMGLKVTGRKPVPLTEEGRALAGALVARFPTLFFLNDQGALKHNSSPLMGRVSVYDTLTAEDVTDEERLSVFAYFTHQQTGEWTQNMNRPDRDLIAFAGKIGVSVDVQRRFTLTAEYLNAYTTPDLAELIATMPDDCRPRYKHGCAKAELVTLILGKAAALKEAGWLPELVAFKG